MKPVIKSVVVQEPSSTQSKRLTIDSWLASSGSLAAADIYPAATDCVRIVLRRTCYNTPAQTHICYTSLKVLGLFIGEICGICKKSGGGVETERDAQSIGLLVERKGGRLAEFDPKSRGCEGEDA
ncbi:hypothetical protein BofuT4_P149750.1 [Botrytis cinerea T4]|uniref:Uncharacterized protein n=1 Tax=Botryotinia fuckeliana (strain T4) TaxID=999810 RepID=G2YXC7_BOTF4|nr:hypothetical protein BofuT4_P149750.1 [Botrytis cinerea T4]